jgi:hypothetical protein
MPHGHIAGPGWPADPPFFTHAAIRMPPMILSNYSLARFERPTAEVVVACRGRCRISAYSVRPEKGRETPGAASRRCTSLRGPWRNHLNETRAAAQAAA